MDTFVAFLLGLAIWSALGLFSVWLLRRNGHTVAWAGLALWMGPIVLLLAQSVPQDSGRVIYFHPGTDLPGSLNVLVGLDGSSGSVTSAKAALEPLRPVIHRIRLVSVIDIETGKAPENYSVDDELIEALHAASRTLEMPEAELALVSGRADHALMTHAVDEAMDLVVVAHRQHRFASVLLGSTVARLAKHSSVPILIGPPTDEESREPENEDPEKNQHVF
ncbi:MAG: universal stress protein [Acidimicrobiales bacterium]|nr:universal stress protein [Acidimicrobiales bacterium]